ncbi:MOSC domain-containing protein [Craterilacuibacter sp.]|uniref:MOSC domain-containing protein n=1 Tax=Craterilacuibacter sp. TaxID=2870909 RepID=UPI003F3C0B64
MPLTHLFVHPLKSCRGIATPRAFASYQGLLHDREWLLATPDGKFISARSDPQLVRVEAELRPGMALFKAPGKSVIAAISTRYTRAAAAVVWGDDFLAWHGDEAVDAWFSDLIGRPCRLLWLGEQSGRTLADNGQALSFADGYPYLLLNQASLDALNLELAEPVSLRHFRPNLVIDGFTPWAEDGWRTIRIGEVVFDIAKPCTRCVLTTIDPDSGSKHRLLEPLRTLGRLRRFADGVHFGSNLIARNQGMLQRGDTVQLLG